MIAPPLTPGSPLARLVQTALQWGHSMETLSGTPLDQVQRTGRVAACLAGQGFSPVIVATPSPEHAAAMHRYVTTHWIHPDQCWVTSPPVGSGGPPRSTVVMAARAEDIERTDPLRDGAEPHVTLTDTGILRMVLDHPILGPR